jgi:hypothetical protein
MRSVVFCVFLIVLSSPALSAPTISCHCFTDRSFDAARPGAADPYFLATTQNSFLAAAFDINKKEIVKARMSGTSEEDLWIGHFVAERSGRTHAEVVDARKQSPNWPEALSLLNPDREQLGSRFTAALEKGSEAALSVAAADEVLTTRLRVAPEVLTELRTTGASTREAIISLFLSRRADHPALAFFTEVQAGNKTWGQLLDGLGIEPGMIEGEIRKLLQGDGSAAKS